MSNYKCRKCTGRISVDFVSGVFLNGFRFFPGLPNGTEAGQEMDQLFTAFQQVLYSNQDKLFKKLMLIYGSRASLAINDIGYIIYGGNGTLRMNHLLICLIVLHPT